MKKETLMSAVMSAGRRCGYEAYSGSQQRMVPELARFPAMWVIPPVMLSQEGRSRGSRLYEAEVRLLRLCADNSAEQKNRAWSEMEEDMARICRLAEAEPGVYYAEPSRITCSEFSMTLSGEISLSAKVTFKVHFCPACSQ